MGVPDGFWHGLTPCRECGAPLASQTVRARGGSWHPDVPLDAYEAVNLLEALKLVKDTGDWHAQLRYRCIQVLRVYGDGTEAPNATAAEMSIPTFRGEANL